MSEPTSPDQPAATPSPQGPPTVPQGPSEQGAVPQWSPPPPGYPTGPPIAGGPPMAPPTGPVPTTAEIPAVPGAPWQPPAAAAPAATTTTVPPAVKGGLKVVAAVVLTLVLVGAALAGISALSGSVPKPEVTVEVCDISARGMVDAGGSLRNKDDAPHTYELTVELSSVRGGGWSRTAKVPVTVGPGGGDDQAEWTTSAQAPQNVEQVSCRVVDCSTS